MNEIVQFKSDTGIDVQITPQDVKNYICPAATDKEVGMFLELCRAQRLNPFIRDAYLVKYGNGPASMITGKEVFTKRANANPNYEGIEHGVVFMRKTPQGSVVDKREGAAVYRAAGETLLGGWARVYVKGKKPVYCELALDEYSTGKSNWAKMPAVMIDKCAQVGALRLAFPSEFQGLYAQEEMGHAGDAVADKSADDPIIIEADAPINEAQQKELDEKAREFAKMRGKSVPEVYDAVINSATLKAAGAASGNITEYQANLAIKLLDNWIAKAEAEQIEAAADAETDASYEQNYWIAKAEERMDAENNHEVYEADELASEDIAF